MGMDGWTDFNQRGEFPGFLLMDGLRKKYMESTTV